MQPTEKKQAEIVDLHKKMFEIGITFKEDLVAITWLELCNARI